MNQTKFRIWLERKDDQLLEAGELTLSADEYGTLTEQDALAQLEQTGELWTDPDTNRVHLREVSTPGVALRAVRAEVVSQWQDEPAGE